MNTTTDSQKIRTKTTALNQPTSAGSRKKIWTIEFNPEKVHESLKQDLVNKTVPVRLIQ